MLYEVIAKDFSKHINKRLVQWLWDLESDANGPFVEVCLSGHCPGYVSLAMICFQDTFVTSNCFHEKRKCLKHLLRHWKGASPFEMFKQFSNGCL